MHVSFKVKLINTFSDFKNLKFYRLFFNIQHKKHAIIKKKKGKITKTKNLKQYFYFGFKNFSWASEIIF